MFQTELGQTLSDLSQVLYKAGSAAGGGNEETFATARTIVYVVMMVIGAAVILFGIFKFAARMKTTEGQKNKAQLKKQMMWTILLGALCLVSPLIVSLVAIILEAAMKDEINAESNAISQQLLAFIKAFTFQN